MRFELDGAEVFAHGRVEGDAPTIVLIHGAAMDHSVWVYNTRYFLHRGYSVLALDLPGHGASTGELLDSVERMAAWVARVVEHLGVGPVRVAGHSMGALVALAYAASAGERVSHLALLGAAVPMAVSDTLLDAARADSPEARAMMVLWGHGPKAHLGGNRVAGLTIGQGAMRLLERAGPGVLFNDLNACNAYLDGMQAASSVSAQTRLVSGTDDKMTPPRAARALAEAMPSCAVDVIPDCGHIMMSERPEATHRALVRALGDR